MAIPNNYIDKITDKDSGESRPICPPADHVSVDNENYEGETLDEVLDEVAQAIEEAGQGGYAPPADGIPKTDLAQSVQDSLDKADSALQDEDVAEVAKTGDYDDLLNKPTIPDTSGLATKTELNAKQDTLVAGNGITKNGDVISVDAEVIQPLSANGTFAIRIGNDTYTINLNHTHEGMAKLEKHTPESLPDVEDMEDDTIYAEIEDGEVNVLYIGGIPFYGGGGGTSTPVLRQPADESTIEVGTIESGQSSVTKTITVKGKNLTQALTVAVTGTGYSVDKQSIPAADANVGTTLTITCTNTNRISAGTLSIASSEVSCDCDLVVYENLQGVKFTGSQWVETDYYPNTNTEFEMDLKLTANANTPATPSDCGIAIMRSFYDTSTDERFTVHVGRSSSSSPYGAYLLFFQNKAGSTNLKSMDFSNMSSEFVADHAKLSYAKGPSAGTLVFDGGTARSVTAALADVNMSTKLDICYNPVVSQIFAAFDLTIYEFTITENGSVVRHWVPKMKNGTLPGLYDTVTGKFISSETSTELVAIS